MKPEDWLDGRCMTTQMPWSIVESSVPNANLAAVLAGFMVTAIVFLLERRRATGLQLSDETDQSTIHTIGLFFAGIVVLGLDSYIFGSIAATRPAIVTITIPEGSRDVVRAGSEYVCAVAWTEGMAASGMLAVGATLLVSGLGWVITDYARLLKNSSVYFIGIGNVFTWCISISTLSLIAVTSSTYIETMGTPHFDLALGWAAVPFIWIATGIIALIVTFTIGMRTRGLALLLRHDDGSGRNAHQYGGLVMATAATGVLALTGPLFARVVAEGSNSVPGLGVAWTAITVGFVLPGLVYIALSYSVPGPTFRWTARAAHARYRHASARRRGWREFHSFSVFPGA